MTSGQIRLVLGGLTGVLGVAIAASLCLGRYPIPLATALDILRAVVTGTAHEAHHAWSDTEFVVVATVRLPRVLIAAVAGAGLGLSGAALQGLFRNPLVGPQVVGIANGAAVGGVVGILLGAGSGGTVAWAFAVALLALAIVFLLTLLSGSAGVLSVVLAGVVVSSFFSALVGLAEFFADPERQLPGLVYWLLGSFAAASKRSLAVVALPTGIAGGVLLLLRWRINVLSLGDADARALGVNVHRLRWTVLALITLIVAAQVSVSGVIGWVGLVVPHLARRLVGANHQHLLPASAVATQELPIGVLTALLGTPVFALVFWRSQADGWARD